MCAEKWFQMPEQGAGIKRLILTKYIYFAFGEFPLRLIAFFAALTVFICANERRKAYQKFLKIINKKFVIISSFKGFLNYANSLADKFISCLGKLDPERFVLDKPGAYRGSFIITAHVGNVEILRSLFQSDKLPAPERVNIFMQSNSCEIFNNFLKSLEIKLNIDVFPVEEIDVQTSMMISERLKNGEIVFMAGDRISAQNVDKVYETDFLGHRVKFPLGTLKFALALDVPICFTVCVKEGKNFKVCTEQFMTEGEKKSQKLEDLKKSYTEFLEKYTLKYPLQSYNFYDIFTD